MERQEPEEAKFSSGSVARQGASCVILWDERQRVRQKVAGIIERAGARPFLVEKLSDLRLIESGVECTRRTMGTKHNLACEQARGEIIAHWDDDDWFADWRLSYQVTELAKHPEMTLTGLSSLYFYRTSDQRAWEYIYPGRQRLWVCGSTFCYRKQFCLKHRFSDLNEGVDTVFVWGLKGAAVVSLENNRWLVGIVHSSNTSPKRPSDPAWRPLPTEHIRSLLSSDYLIYEEFSESSNHS
jgi:hypothetical protein